MVRLLHMLSVLAVLATAGVLVLWRAQPLWDDTTCDSLLARRGTIESFAANGHKTSAMEEPVSPLLAAAQTFSSYLNPPALVPERLVVQEAPRPMPTVRPPAPSPKFKLRGTSYAGDRPERSMALIWEPGATDNGQWIKQGARIGHFILREVRPGSIVYLDGDQVHEMAVETETLPTVVIASSGGASAPDARIAANVQAAPPIESARRPRPSRSMTVGSARTAALD